MAGAEEKKEGDGGGTAPGKEAEATVGKEGGEGGGAVSAVVTLKGIEEVTVLQCQRKKSKPSQGYCTPDLSSHSPSGSAKARSGSNASAMLTACTDPLCERHTLC